MSCIVYQTNKKTGIKYAYSSESYWDKEKQQPRSRRKYLGRVDPEAGGISRKTRSHHFRMISLFFRKSIGKRSRHSGRSMSLQK